MTARPARMLFVAQGFTRVGRGLPWRVGRARRVGLMARIRVRMRRRLVMRSASRRVIVPVSMRRRSACMMGGGGGSMRRPVSRHLMPLVVSVVMIDPITRRSVRVPRLAGRRHRGQAMLDIVAFMGRRRVRARLMRIVRMIERSVVARALFPPMLAKLGMRRDCGLIRSNVRFGSGAGFGARIFGGMTGPLMRPLAQAQKGGAGGRILVQGDFLELLCPLMFRMRGLAFMSSWVMGRLGPQAGGRRENERRSQVQSAHLPPRSALKFIMGRPFPSASAKTIEIRVAGAPDRLTSRERRLQ